MDYIVAAESFVVRLMLQKDQLLIVMAMLQGFVFQNKMDFDYL
jgi:hypothetical protein